MVCLAIAGVFPWAAVAVVAAKELVMFFGGMYMLSRGVVVYSNYWGKTAQVFFIASLLLSFFHPGLVAGNVGLFGVTALVVYTCGAAKKIKS